MEHDGDIVHRISETLGRNNKSRLIRLFVSGICRRLELIGCGNGFVGRVLRHLSAYCPREPASSEPYSGSRSTFSQTIIGSFTRPPAPKAPPNPTPPPPPPPPSP